MILEKQKENNLWKSPPPPSGHSARMDVSGKQLPRLASDPIKGHSEARLPPFPSDKGPEKIHNPQGPLTKQPSYLKDQRPASGREWTWAWECPKATSIAMTSAKQADEAWSKETSGKCSHICADSSS